MVGVRTTRLPIMQVTSSTVSKRLPSTRAGSAFGFTSGLSRALCQLHHHQTSHACPHARVVSLSVAMKREPATTTKETQGLYSVIVAVVVAQLLDSQ
jgi:hypothetical protein